MASRWPGRKRVMPKARQSLGESQVTVFAGRGKGAVFEFGHDSRSGCDIKLARARLDSGGVNSRIQANCGCDRLRTGWSAEEAKRSRPRSEKVRGTNRWSR